MAQKYIDGSISDSSNIVLFYKMSALIQMITFSMLKQVKYRMLQKHAEHDTLSVSLPVQWTRLLGLKKADAVKVSFEENRRIIVERATD